MIKKYFALFDEFKKRLDEHRFYDAHESLEEIWFPKRFEDCDETRLIKGFINAAVSCELAKKGRYESSEKVWKTYLKYKPLVHKINSKYKADYHALTLHVEKIKQKVDIKHNKV